MFRSSPLPLLSAMWAQSGPVCHPTPIPVAGGGGKGAPPHQSGATLGDFCAPLQMGFTFLG